jgi:diguanylate cyclase (GGDEF)-like protein/PAS domain S-box-containing protein
MKAKILIVEDESIIARDLQFTLEDLGYDVPETANSGESALEKVPHINPNLILMDIRILGEMDGIATAKQILQQFDIPIVYLTAHADEDTLARAKLTTPYGYIIKPFEERELRTTIEIALYKHQQEKQLKENAQWLTIILNSIGDGVIATDERGLITFLNPAAETLTGWSLVKAIGKESSEVFKLVDGNTRKIIDSPVKRVLKTGEIFHLPENVILLQYNGREIYISDSIAPIVNNRGIIPLDNSLGILLGTVIIFRDVTEQRLSAQNLHRKAFYDSLTNLPNRDWFRERSIDAIDRVKRNPKYLFAVLFLDLDDFKKVNDNLGHPVGDKLLIGVAARLAKAVRSCDTVARLGGDEFAIILENLSSPHESSKIAERIIKDLSVPWQINGHELSINTSIGIVLSSFERLEVEELIRDADIAMYRAKERGKGCYEIFNREMHLEILATSQLENELRQAISENQLTPYYQPIVNLPQQEIIGFEALVRWIHPERGLISPAKFIPIAEETGLITQIDLWMLQQACSQLKIWQETNAYSSSLTISVNLSCRHFQQPNCVNQIEHILETAQIDPSCIKLEITETILIENTASATEILTELSNLGIAISLDDFGTGYSSLSYLQQFPLDILKIDRCFIRNLHENTKNATITKALIDIAHQLNLTVVAEGVETEAELGFLSENKCDTIQGYFFSPPLAIEDLARLTLPKVSLK